MNNNETKRKIFYSAAELFAKRTFAGVSVRDIADKVGIKAASIYYHYENKEEILNDILTYYMDRMEVFFKETKELTKSSDYVPKLDDIFYVYPPDEVELMTWITRIIHMEQFTSDKAADALMGYTKFLYSEGFECFFRALAHQGVIKEENCENYADLLIRIGHSFQLDFIHRKTPGSPDHFRQTYERLFKLILHFEGSSDYYFNLTKK